MSAKRENRIGSIYTYLNKVGYASIPELALTFEVSKSTIKRDLDLMDKENMIERVHGGATVIKNETVRLYQIRKNINAAEKLRIAKTAANFVDDDDVIFIDAGSTCFSMYAEIRAKNVTVFTSNLSILTYEIENENENVSHLYTIEGELQRDVYMIGGTLSIENLKRINPSKIFFSTSAISKNFDILCDNDILSIFLKNLIEMQGKKYFLLDASKIGETRAFKVNSINHVDTMITDDRISKTDITALKELAPDLEIIIV